MSRFSSPQMTFFRNNSKDNSMLCAMPAELRTKLQQAFLELDSSTPQGKEVVALQRATRFIPTRAENYVGIRAAAENAGLLK